MPEELMKDNVQELPPTPMMDVTMMCKMEVPAHPVTVYNTESGFICPHCGTAIVTDLKNMKIDHPKHELRQIVEKTIARAK